MSRAVWYNISIPWMVEFSEYSIIIIIIIIIRYGALPHYTVIKNIVNALTLIVLFAGSGEIRLMSLLLAKIVVSEWFMGTQQLSRVVYVLPEGY